MYDVYHTTYNALKLQLLATTYEVYYRDLYDDNIGYISVSTQLLLDHIWAVYRQIDGNQIATNIVRMSTHWFPTIPIDTLFEQLKLCIQFTSKGNNPTTSTANIRIGALVIEESNILLIASK